MHFWYSVWLLYCCLYEWGDATLQSYSVFSSSLTVQMYQKLNKFMHKINKKNFKCVRKCIITNNGVRNKKTIQRETRSLFLPY